MSGWLPHSVPTKGTHQLSVRYNSTEETAKPSTQSTWLWLTSFLIPHASPVFTWQSIWKLPSLILLPTVLFFTLFCLQSVWLTTAINRLLLHFSVSHRVCRTSPASPPLQAPPPPQGQEGAQEAQEARPQRGRTPQRRGGPEPQPWPLLNQKKTQHWSLSVSQLSKNTTSHLNICPSPFPAPHSSTPGSQSRLGGFPKCCQTSPGHWQDYLFTLYCPFSLFLSLCLCLTCSPSSSTLTWNIGLRWPVSNMRQ